jgi:hypothetical protein
MSFDTRGFVTEARKNGIPDTEILGYLQKQGVAPVPQQPQAPEQVGFGKSLLRGLANPFLRMGANVRAVGDIATGQQPQESYSFGNILGEARTIGQTGNFGQDLRDALGVGVETASFIPFGRGVKAGVEAVKGGQRIARAAATGAREGAIGGALQGVGVSMQDEDATVGSGLMATGLGTVMGGVGGGALLGLGAAGKGVYSSFANRAARKAELEELLSNPNTPISQRIRERTGNQPLDEVVKNDKSLQEAVTQGVDPTTAFAIRHSNADTKALMQESLDVAEKVFGAEGFNPARSSDVVGKPFVARVNTLQTSLKQAGKEIDEASKGLVGQQVDYTPAVNNFADELIESGARITPDGKLDLSDSIYGDIPKAKTALTKVWNRLQKMGDAKSVHDTKKFIDEFIEYGKSTDGVAGSSERMIKGFRAELDDVLDTAFPDYNLANSKYGEIRNILDEVSQVAGKDVVKGPVNVAEGRAGQMIQRILSNSPNRAKITNLLSNVDELGRKYGYTGNDDLVTLNAFTDSLEDVFGTQAKRSLQGQVKRGTTDLVAGNVAGADLGASAAAMKLVRTGIEASRGINRENYIKAIRELLSQQ